MKRLFSSAMCILMLAAFIIPLSAFATEGDNAGTPAPDTTVAPAPVGEKAYSISSLGISFILPGDWTTATRDTPDGDQALTDLDYYDHAAFIAEMEERNVYLVSKQIESVDTYEIMVSAFPCDTNVSSITDFRGCETVFGFEMKMLAKYSFEALNDNVDGYVYDAYEVVNASNVPYMLFKGTYKDANGNTVYRALADTYVCGMEIQVDLTAYSEIDAAHLDTLRTMMFEMTVPAYDGNRALMETLRYVALAVLAIALVVVIVVFIISQSKVKKAEAAAYKLAQEAAANRDSGMNIPAAISNNKPADGGSDSAAN